MDLLYVLLREENQINGIRNWEDIEMKSYTITVNGNVYDVLVEENGADAVHTASTPKPVTPKTMPQKAPEKAATQGAGNIKVASGAAGKVFKIEVSVGQKVEKGDTVMIVEAMKMEIPVVAPEAGTVASIDVTVGNMIEAGQVLATLN